MKTVGFAPATVDRLADGFAGTAERFAEVQTNAARATTGGSGRQLRPYDLPPIQRHDFRVFVECTVRPVSFRTSNPTASSLKPIQLFATP
jgi:hypothetical protein